MTTLLDTLPPSTSFPAVYGNFQNESNGKNGSVCRAEKEALL